MGKNFSTKQLATIDALIRGESIKAAAAQARVSRSSVYNWLRKPEFRSEIQKRKQELFEEGLGKLKAATTKAADSLIGLLKSPEESERRLAARTILHFAFKGHETEDLLERIEKIEQMLERRVIS